MRVTITHCAGSTNVNFLDFRFSLIESSSISTDDTKDANAHNYVRGVALDPDGKYLAAGSEDNVVRVSMPLTLNSYDVPTLLSIW